MLHRDTGGHDAVKFAAQHALRHMPPADLKIGCPETLEKQMVSSKKDSKKTGRDPRLSLSLCPTSLISLCFGLHGTKVRTDQSFATKLSLHQSSRSLHTAPPS